MVLQPKNNLSLKFECWDYFEKGCKHFLEDLKEDIENKIQEFFPDVVVGEVNVVANQDVNEVVVNITYAVANTGIEDEINLSFQ